ncbi:divalent metal cation transporter [Bacillus pumilus]|nr:divalent metal cation transporter [Bacillus pumilus]
MALPHPVLIPQSLESRQVKLYLKFAREEFPKPVSIGLWIQGELVIIATDLAEFIGAALGFILAFSNPSA